MMEINVSPVFSRVRPVIPLQHVLPAGINPIEGWALLKTVDVRTLSMRLGIYVYHVLHHV